MEKQLALHIVRTAFRSAAILEDLLPLVRDHCKDDDAKTYGLAIASAIADIHRELTNRVFSSFPEVQAEVEAAINSSGRVP